MSSEITAITLTPFSIPLVKPVHFASSVLRAADHLLVEVHTDSEVVGVAEAIPRPMIYGETHQSIAEATRLISNELVGTRIDEIERSGQRLANIKGNPVAKGSIELALYDALGKSLGISCHRLLGGFTNKVPVTLIIGMGTADEVVDSASVARTSLGIRSFKVKVGRNVHDDIRTICALREAIPDATICPDANQGYSVADALTFFDGTVHCELAWIEEPCFSDDLLGKSRAANLSRTAFLGDESCTTVREVVTEVLAGRSSMISIKLARTGVRESIRIRDFCSAIGVGLIVGSQGDSTLGTWAGVSFAAASASTVRYPSELSYFLDLEGSICRQDPIVVDGHISVPEASGFGAKVDWDKFEKFRIA